MAWQSFGHGEIATDASRLIVPAWAYGADDTDEPYGAADIFVKPGQPIVVDAPRVPAEPDSDAGEAVDDPEACTTLPAEELDAV
jgi:hypothetical protein